MGMERVPRITAASFTSLKPGHSCGSSSAFAG